MSFRLFRGSIGHQQVEGYSKFPSGSQDYYFVQYPYLTDIQFEVFREAFHEFYGGGLNSKEHFPFVEVKFARGMMRLYDLHDLRPYIKNWRAFRRSELTT